MPCPWQAYVGDRRGRVWVVCGRVGGVNELDLTGKLLVATPQVVGAEFAESVILLLHHDPNGAHGIILNKTLDAPVSAVLADWQDHVSEPGVLFSGGPVGTDTAVGLVHMPGIMSTDEELGLHMILGAVGLVDLDMPPEVIAAQLAGMRVFIGYAGWGPEQLEGELARADWVIADFEPADAFTADPEGLWQQVLRRQHSAVSFLVTYPEETLLN